MKTVAHASGSVRPAVGHRPLRLLAPPAAVDVIALADGAPASTGSTAAEDADEIDVTIVLGSDAQDLIGRLESSG